MAWAYTSMRRRQPVCPYFGKRKTRFLSVASPLFQPKRVPQQRRAAPKSAVPSRNSAKEAAIQLLSAVLGRVAVAALAVLALNGVDAAVLVTVVLVVLVVVAATFPGEDAIGGIEPLSERDIGESGGNEYSSGASRFTCRACKETYSESAEMGKKG